MFTFALPFPMHISSRPISPDHPPYVIAELGVNHDGSPERALELVERAASAGVDAVKFQYFRAEMLMSGASRLAGYQAEAGERDPIQMLRRLELSIDALDACVKRAHALGVHAIVTVFSLPLVPLAAKLPWDAYKTASPDIVHRPLLEALCALNKPLIISTGASEPHEITRALGWLSGARHRTAILQCVSSYPTPMDSAELGGIAALADLFDGPIGYSDHTPGERSGMLAAAAGATILEKHFTHDVGAQGPDHAASLEALPMRRYADGARLGWQTLQRARSTGARAIDERHQRFDDGVMREIAPFERIKRVLDIERDVRSVSRQSIVAARAIAPGQVVVPADVCFKRPGGGIAPFELASVLGRRTTRAVAPDAPIQHDDLAPAATPNLGSPATGSNAKIA